MAVLSLSSLLADTCHVLLRVLSCLALPLFGVQNRQEIRKVLNAVSLQCGELHPESCILDSNGLMSAHQESDESKDGQEKDWHGSRLFVFIPFQVNLLQADGILANDRHATLIWQRID